ncbi:hypothetical protein NTGBS_220023 [Candidatus Nitrotoga sp. BS]|nr:hypothetical protein NTGBS_220023 [Candidatus Nitrotoga sp. BS]
MDMMMSQKEAVRGQVMELLKARKIDQKEAGQRLGVSVRQIKHQAHRKTIPCIRLARVNQQEARQRLKPTA